MVVGFCHAMDSDPRRLAVLIDGDFIDPADFGRVFAWAAGKGEVVMRRIYGNRVKLSDWRKCIDNHRIEPVSNYADGKNAADFTMTIDAMDILHTREDVNGLCIGRGRQPLCQFGQAALQRRIFRGGTMEFSSK